MSVTFCVVVSLNASTDRIGHFSVKFATEGSYLVLCGIQVHSLKERPQLMNKAIIDYRLRPLCTTHDEQAHLLVFIVEQTLDGLSAVRPIQSYSVAVQEYTRHATQPLCETMTSSAKPEVHQNATAPEDDRNTVKGNMHRKIGEVQPCGFRVMRADRETERNTHYNSFYGGKVITIVTRRQSCYFVDIGYFSLSLMP